MLLKHGAFLTDFAVDIRYFNDEFPDEILLINIDKVEEALLSFRAFAKEKLGEFWVE